MICIAMIVVNDRRCFALHFFLHFGFQIFPRSRNVIHRDGAGVVLVMMMGDGDGDDDDDDDDDDGDDDGDN